MRKAPDTSTLLVPEFPRALRQKVRARAILEGKRLHEWIIAALQEAVHARERGIRFTGPLVYQQEKVGDAIRILMSLTMPAAKRAHGAMGEAFLAFHSNPPPADAEKCWKKIQRIMSGSGAWEERAKQLDEAKLSELSKAFWELDRTLSRKLYEWNR